MEPHDFKNRVVQEFLYCIGDFFLGLLEMIASVVCELFAELLSALFRL